MVFWKHLFFTAICLIYVKSQGTNKEEMIDIATIDTNMTDLLQDLHKGMPEILKFTLNTMNNSKPIKLTLKRKKTVKENSFVFIVRQDKNGNSVLVKENVPVEKNIGLYQDKNTGAAFTVRCEGLENGFCNPVLFGSIHIDNVEYDLTEIATVDESMTTTSPTVRKKRRAKKGKGLRNKKGRRVYALMKRKRPRGFAQDYKIFDKPIARSNLITKETNIPLGKALPLRMRENIVDLTAEKLPVLGRTMVSSSRSRMNVAADDTYNVELLLVIDYSIYLREYNAIQDKGVFNKDMEAKQRIRHYFAHVVNGMNLRYDNIDTKKFHINVAVSGYIIADKPEIAVWTAKRVANKLVDSDDALDLLRSWRLSVSELPEHDHMMLFTSYDLYRHRVSDNKVTGLASYKAMCSSSSVSVVEDNGVYGSISTGTHELAHSLGASHDGTGSNMCSSREQYIMAVTGGVTNSVNELNPWKFSPCSIDELHRFLRNLPPGNCLTDEALIYDTDEFNKVTSNAVGQVYTPNEQCRQRAGKNSFYGWGGGLGEYNEICTSMACKSETSENSYLIYTAARGTSCGDQRWCVNGLCTTDPKAPRQDENCVHGDSKKLFDGQTCSQLIRADPSRCYQKYYRGFCCQTCKDIAKPIQGCEFGDKNSFCSTALTRPHLCYSQRNQEVCCDTCQSLYTGYKGCEYGDKVHQNGGRRCSQWRCSGNPDYQKACCKTCGLIPDIPTVVKPTRRPVITTRKPIPKPTPRPTPVRTVRPIQPTRPPPVPPTRSPRVVPTAPPPVRPTTSGELCVVAKGNFRTMTCDLVAKWMSNICSVSVLRETCCEPCKPKPVANGCKDLDSCSNVRAAHCYDTFVKDRCCSTCKSLETGNKDCLYGDKSTTCDRYVFLWPDYICKRHPDRCCDSCKNKSNQRSTITILSRKMESNIANTLDNTSDSPFRNSVGQSAKVDNKNAVSETSPITNDLPTRGDQVPIHTGKVKPGKNAKDKKDKKKRKDKHKKKHGGASKHKKEKHSPPPNGDRHKDTDKQKRKRKKGKHWRKYLRHKKRGKWRSYHH